MALLTITLLWSMLDFITLGVAQDRGKDARARFEREYPEAGAALEAKAKRDGKLKAVKTMELTTAQQVKRDVEVYTLWRSGEKVRLDVQRFVVAGDGEGGQEKRVFKDEASYVSADGRMFVVGRPGADRPYVSRGPIAGLPLLKIRFADTTGAATHIESQRLVDLLAHPAVTVTGISEVEEGGRSLVQVNYNRMQRDGKRSEICSARLDPARNWALVGFRQVLHPERDLEARLSYDDGPERRDDAIPRSIEMEISGMVGTQPYSARRKLEFGPFEPGPIPDREFTLSAFGLPEMKKPAGD